MTEIHSASRSQIHEMSGSVFAMLARALMFLLALQSVRGVTRTYYIGIREEKWDYSPGGGGGGVFLKALYRQYTDASYTKEVPKPQWLGFLGPVIRAQVDDVIVVHLKNFARRNYSIHPHGLFYKKDSEGAFYPDNTTAEWKADDKVQPGQSHTYTWIVQSEFAPAEGDASCLSWAYHSHVDAPKDIASGLVGPLLTCKKGYLKEESGGVDAEFFLMFSVVEENLSWYYKDNLDKNPQLQHDESSYKHCINGYMFGTLPGLSVCRGVRVDWHLMAMGNEADVHSVHFYGHTLLERGHRRDVISVFPATFTTATMVPMTTGKWMLSDQVNNHFKAGLRAFYEVTTCSSGDPVSTETSGKVRHYYISAEEQEWDYGPRGVDEFTGLNLTQVDSDPEVFFGHMGGALGGRYLKARYVGYTDDKFTTRLETGPTDTHLGILGPVISAEVGDTIVVTFFNKASRTYSIQPHGLHYHKHYEAIVYQDGVERGKASVAPGKHFVYQWKVLEGPSPSDPPCQSRLYYSAHEPINDTNSGLVGALKICRKGVLDPDGKQRDVDKEFFLLFGIFDENLSWYLQKNIQRHGDASSQELVNDFAFMESNKMHGVNGLLYGNMRGLEVCVGERVVWHTLGLGSQVDVHGVYFQGNVFSRYGNTRDTLSLFPHTSVTVTMTAHNAGNFSVSCRTTDHFVAGMRHKYTVRECNSSSSNARTHTLTHRTHYFLSAEEVEWDYAPSRAWELEKHGAEDSPGSVFVEKGKRRIGSRYKKVVFRQYTDSSFSTRAPVTAQDTHLGILGPILRLQVGDEVSVTFKNSASRPYSLHAHGVEPQSLDQSEVPPGEIRKYLWNVPERVGPGPNDPNCISYVYYSTTNYVRDLASGLVGPLIVCRHGVLDKGRRSDVDREFALLFMVFDENESWYLQENIRTYLSADTHDPDDPDDEYFMESNKMHSINGRLYGTLSGLEMQEGDQTVWYLLGLGNEVDMHTVHFHAHTFTYKETNTHRADVFDLFPGTFQAVSLTAKHPGTWLLHCHVNDHIHAGMETTYTIHPRGQRSATAYNNYTGQEGQKPNPGNAETSSKAPVAVVITVVVFITIIIIITVIVLKHRQAANNAAPGPRPPEQHELMPQPSHTQ